MNGTHATELLNKPSYLEVENKYRFLIFDAPTDENLHLYVQEFEKRNVKHVVRVCDPTYKQGAVESAGIQFYDWPFRDGDAPPEEIVTNWLGLVTETFKAKGTTAAIGLHCVAGLGR